MRRELCAVVAVSRHFGWRPRSSSAAALVGALVLILVMGASAVTGGAHAADAAGERFLRGDANGDGRLSLSDVLAILHHIHKGKPLPCVDAGDVDDSGSINATDFGYLLGTIFWRHSPPPPPYPSVGSDPTPDDLDCARSLFIGRAVPGEEDDGDEGEDAAPGRALEDCTPDNGGVDTEFILFRERRVFVYPGQENVRVPIQMSALENVEAVTFSLRVEPALIELEEIDFGVTISRFARGSSPFVHTFRGLRSEGYLASTLILDLSGSGARLDELFYDTVAYLEFSVPEDVPLGTEMYVRFEDTPSSDDLPPIPNELVRSGRTLRGTFCGLPIEVVPREAVFVRGDANRNGRIELSDAVAIINHLFSSDSFALPCPDAADIDDDGTVQLTDATRLLRYLFGGGSPPFPPFELAGIDFWNPDSLPCGPGTGN